MKNLILAILLSASQVLAQSAPPSVKGQTQAGYLRPKPNLQFPYNQVTNLGGLDALIETDYNNLLSNPSFENIVSTSGWTFGSGVSPALDSTNVYSGKQAVALTLTAVNGLVISQDLTPTIQISGQPMEYGIRVKTSATTVQVCARQAGATVGNCNSIVGNNTWQYLPLNISGPASGSVGVSVITTGSTTGTVVVETGYVGYARNLIQTQTVLSGGFVSPTTSTEVQFTGTSYATLNSSIYGTKTFFGTLCVASGTANDFAMTCNLPAGSYHLSAPINMRTDGSSQCTARIYDGTTEIAKNYTVSSNGGASTTVVEGNVNYTTGTTSTFSVQYQRTNGTVCYHGGGSAAGLAYIPAMTITQIGSTAGMALAANTPSNPVWYSLSGSGTFQTPPGASSLEIEVIAGGGGGAGSSTVSTASGTDGGNGGNTTFGGTLVVANGGQGGGAGSGACYPGGAGGTISVGAVSQTITSYPGAKGQSGCVYGTGGFFACGIGGTSPMGSPGSAEVVSGASAGVGYGAGGGGGSTNNVGGNYGGGGGGAGGYAKVAINAPAASYAYVVGSGGTAGPQGSSGQPGGAGAPGRIIIKVNYGAVQAPLLIGSVQTNASNAITTIVSGTAGSSLTGNCTSSPCVLTNSDPALTSVTRSGVGRYLLTLNPTVCPGKSRCYFNGNSTGVNNAQCSYDGIPTTNVVGFVCVPPGSGSTADAIIDITCFCTK